MKNVTTTLQAVVVAALVLGCQSTPPATPPAPQPANPAETRQEAPPPAAPAPAAAPVRAPEPAAATEAKPETMTIMDVQKRLAELGYNPGPADGLSGKKTGDALKKFQQANNLPPTGVLDSETIRRLRSAKR